MSTAFVPSSGFARGDALPPTASSRHVFSHSLPATRYPLLATRYSLLATRYFLTPARACILRDLSVELIHAFAELLGQLRLLGGQVGLFSRIVGKVAEPEVELGRVLRHRLPSLDAELTSP